MANRKNQHIYSTAFNEYTFRALKNITPEQKENLTVNELKYFSKDYSLQEFCKEATMEYKLHLLAKVGISWTFRMEREKSNGDMLEYLTQDQYQYPQKRVDITEATSREGVCVISSREVMTLSHMLAQNCTTQVYSISEFSKILQSKMKSVKTLTSWDDEVERTQEGYEVFVKILIEQLNSIDYAKGVLGMDEADIRILSALYLKRNSAVKMNQISEMARTKGRKMYFRKNIKGLIESGYVTSDRKDPSKLWANNTFFMITTKGIGRYLEYVKFVYGNSFGT
jgi:hypothetical protein